MQLHVVLGDGRLEQPAQLRLDVRRADVADRLPPQEVAVAVGLLDRPPRDGHDAERVRRALRRADPRAVPAHRVANVQHARRVDADRRERPLRARQRGGGGDGGGGGAPPLLLPVVRAVARRRDDPVAVDAKLKVELVLLRGRRARLLLVRVGRVAHLERRAVQREQHGAAALVLGRRAQLLGAARRDEGELRDGAVVVVKRAHERLRRRAALAAAQRHLLLHLPPRLAAVAIAAVAAVDAKRRADRQLDAPRTAHLCTAARAQPHPQQPLLPRRQIRRPRRRVCRLVSHDLELGRLGLARDAHPHAAQPTRARVAHGQRDEPAAQLARAARTTAVATTAAAVAPEEVGQRLWRAQRHMRLGGAQPALQLALHHEPRPQREHVRAGLEVDRRRAAAAHAAAAVHVGIEQPWRPRRLRRRIEERSADRAAIEHVVAPRRHDEHTDRPRLHLEHGALTQRLHELPPLHAWPVQRQRALLGPHRAPLERRRDQLRQDASPRAARIVLRRPVCKGTALVLEWVAVHFVLADGQRPHHVPASGRWRARLARQESLGVVGDRALLRKEPSCLRPRRGAAGSFQARK